MKSSLMLPLLIVSTTISALPCPNGNGILYKGDSVAEVIKQCGEPSAKHTSTNVLHSQQKLIYYRGHFYDKGYSQLTIFFQNDKVSSINVLDHYWLPVCIRQFVQIGQISTVQTSCNDWVYSPYNTNLCGRIFGVGDNIQYVKSVCGTPATQSNLETTQIETTELTYGGNNSQTIVFQNDKLVEWK